MSREQLQTYLPRAMALPAAGLHTPRMDVSTVIQNAQRGVAAVLARRDDIAKIPGVSLDEIESLAAMGRALTYATARFVPIAGDSTEAIAQARSLRAKLLVKADSLVVDGIVPPELVAAIRKGHGPIDAARDCVELAALFHKYAAKVPGSVTVDPHDVQTADDLGSRLLATLRPRSIKRVMSPEQLAAADVRDRMWTLFEQTWEQHVWVAGAVLFRRDVDQHVPGLTAGRRRTKPTVTQPVQPAPQTPTTPAPVAAAA